MEGDTTMGQQGTWYYSLDGTGEVYGTAESREHAITELDGRAGFIGLGDTPEIKLSEYISGDEVIENAENTAHDISDPNGDGLFSNLTNEQVTDLGNRLRAAADEWQKAHALAFQQWAIVWQDGPHEINHS